MARVKGCANQNCLAYRSIYYKEENDYCTKCGEKLVYVCKRDNCWTILDDNTKEKYCKYHIAENKDKKDNALSIVEKAGGIVFGAFVVIGTIVKTVAKKK